MRLYEHDYGMPPDSDKWGEQLFAANLLSPRDTIPPTDQFGQNIIYRIPGEHERSEFYSVGEDGIDNNGEGDDISSWAGVNDGCYWKTNWPKGRATIRYSVFAGITLFIIGIISRRKVLLPIGLSVVCIGLVLGCSWLKHPGVAPSRNSLLSSVIFGAIIVLGLVVFFSLIGRIKLVLKTGIAESATE